jgi:signal transduction histidine kinase
MKQQLEDTQDLGRCILDHQDAIIDQWERLSREENPEACSEQRKELRNSLPQFLERLGETLSQGSTRVPRTFAVEHGIQRWRIGWDVASLARDFMVLRRVLVAHLRRNVDLDTDDVMAISAALDEAVSESVSAYVAHRELELNKKHEALERKNYELKRFAHMVAHEIRNPLGLITLATSSLKRLVGDEPKAAQQIERITEGRRQIIEVVDNLVKYASSVGGVEFEPDEVHLDRVYDEAVGHLKYFIESSGATVTRGPLPTVRGNAVALRSLLQNLIENALKYAGDGPPRIHVWAVQEPGGLGAAPGAEQARVDPTSNGHQPHTPPTTPTTTTTQSGSAWAISVRDEGIGISPEDQTLIFRFLARVNVNEHVHGTGVGLALCRRVAEQHGGTLTVESEPGKGSTFTLRLPA